MQSLGPGNQCAVTGLTLQGNPGPFPGGFGEGRHLKFRRDADLGTIRHRSEVVEFRVEQHLEALKDRLGVLRFGTANDTTEQAEAKQKSPPLLRVIGIRISGVGPAPGARSRARERATSCDTALEVGPARLERATSCSGGKRSIQLSYGP